MNDDLATAYDYHLVEHHELQHRPLAPGVTIESCQPFAPTNLRPEPTDLQPCAVKGCFDFGRTPDPIRDEDYYCRAHEHLTYAGGE